MIIDYKIILLKKKKSKSRVWLLSINIYLRLFEYASIEYLNVCLWVSIMVYAPYFGHLGAVWIRLLRFAFTFLLFSFLFSFFSLLLRMRLWDKWLLFMYSSRILLTFQPLLSVPWVPWTVHGIHKLHFSATSSLKMSPTILFTHLKIILLQYF